MVQLREGFWHVRAAFKVFGLVSIGTHMSIIRLTSGRFLIIDTVPLDEVLKRELDELTHNGELVDAVIATHPFHTLAFPLFHEVYPSLKYFGTPRHLRNIHSIPWTGDIRFHLTDWIPEVEMRIPDGAEFVAPLPEISNHFSAVWVFSRAHRMVHVDDTVNLYSRDVGILLRLIGVVPGEFSFHPSLKSQALLPTSEAPDQFARWFQAILDEWDFDSICCAHRDVMIGGVKPLLQQTLERARPLLARITERNLRRQAAGSSSGNATSGVEEDAEAEQAVAECSKLNVSGNECG